jgi:hypothetical protein
MSTIKMFLSFYITRKSKMGLREICFLFNFMFKQFRWKYANNRFIEFKKTLAWFSATSLMIKIKASKKWKVYFISFKENGRQHIILGFFLIWFLFFKIVFVFCWIFIGMHYKKMSIMIFKLLFNFFMVLK